MPTINHTLTLEVETCCACGIVFAMPAEMQRQRRTDGGLFYCPHGHGQSYSEPELQKMHKRLLQEQAAREQAEAHSRDDRLRREAAERREATLRGDVDKLKKRIAGGTCPCCGKKFTSLDRHMKRAHPSYADSDVTSVEGVAQVASSREAPEPPAER